MDHSAKLLKSKGFTEVFVGIWESPLYETSFDFNSGGMMPSVTGEDVPADYVLEDSRVTQFLTVIWKYTAVEYRADLPF